MPLAAWTTGADYSALPDRYIEQGCTNLGTVQLASAPLAPTGRPWA